MQTTSWEAAGERVGRDFATAARWWAEVPAMNPTLYAVPRPSDEAFHRLRGPKCGDAKTLREKKARAHGAGFFLLSTFRIANLRG